MKIKQFFAGWAVVLLGTIFFNMFFNVIESNGFQNMFFLNLDAFKFTTITYMIAALIAFIVEKYILINDKNE